MPKRMAPRRSKGITSITYWRKFASHRIIYVFLALIFAFGIVLYFGGSPMGGGRRPGATEEKRSETIATVNGEPIERGDYEQAWDSERSMLAGQPESRVAAAQGELVSMLVDLGLERSVAKRKGISVTDADVDREIERLRDRFSPSADKKISDEELAAQAQVESISELRGRLKIGLLPRFLGEALSGSEKLGYADLDKSYDEVKIRHILVAVNTSPRRPEHSLPDEQARAKAEKILAEVRAGKPFEALANQYTDDPSNNPKRYDPKLKKDVPVGAPKGGDLGWYKRGGGFDKAFEDAAFALKPGQIGGIVKTAFGYHIIKVDAQRRQLPKDYDKQKPQLLEQLKQTKINEAIEALKTEQHKTMKLVWKDPSMEWRYLLSKTSGGMMGMMGMSMGGGDPKDEQALFDMLLKYSPGNPSDGAAALILGRKLYEKYLMFGLNMPGGPKPPAPSDSERTKLRDEAIKSLEVALKSVEDSESSFLLARLYQDAKKPDKALEQYKAIQRVLKWSSAPDAKQQHQQLVSAFQSLGHPEFAAIDIAKIAEITAQEKKDAAERAATAAKEKAEADARAKAAADKKKGLGQKPGAPGTTTIAPVGPAPTGATPVAPPAGGTSAPAPKTGASKPTAP